jgi:hypothetical protein
MPAMHTVNPRKKRAQTAIRCLRMSWSVQTMGDGDDTERKHVISLIDTAVFERSQRGPKCIQGSMSKV